MKHEAGRYASGEGGRMLAGREIQDGENERHRKTALSDARCAAFGGTVGVMRLSGEQRAVAGQLLTRGLLEQFEQIGLVQVLLFLAGDVHDDAAFVHHDEPVAQADGVVHVVGDHHGGEVLFIGKEGGMETDLVTKEGFKISCIKVAGFKRSLSLSNFKTAYLAAKGVSETKKIIKNFNWEMM